MSFNNIDRLRGMLMFVIAWLTALYVFEIFQEIHAKIGFFVAALTFGVNLYARRRAALCAPGSVAFKFWQYLPAILFLALPVLIKIVVYFTAEDHRSWWSHLLTLLPFLLKLGVPAMVLLWVYISLGRLRPQKLSDEESTGDGDAP